MDFETFKKKRDRVLEIDRISKEILEEKERLIKELQETCSHELIIEFDNHMAGLGDTRVCGLCGLQEEHTGSGFHTLTREPIKQKEKYYLTRYLDLKPLEEFFSRNVVTKIANLMGI